MSSFSLVFSRRNILYSTTWYTILPLYIDHRKLIPKRSLRRKVYPKLHIWYDGFFTLMLNGKVYKHIADKMMPNQDTATKKKDMRMAGKLALFTGFVSIFSNNEDSLN
ncbi:uncharacterized protein LOC112457409 isoform X1 [Temnothorax curvispinosus]|uniref:Uncharacterized protein LOC112457409 isoform X1 n=1 Tax=Temnothorax curvispinosus TaxID=300111 RepID=A0A6J1Q5L1_9HYME|nr:uncharacterized protein LOC112457409 isoform X1 [Temnothorax curvispinosus]